jgi:hypothetical protein
MNFSLKISRKEEILEIKKEEGTLQAKDHILKRI